MENCGVFRKERKGKFKVNIDQMRTLFIEMPLNRKLFTEMSDKERSERRLEDNRRSAHNSHLKREIKLAEMEQLHSENLAKHTQLAETVQRLRKASVHRL